MSGNLPDMMEVEQSPRIKQDRAEDEQDYRPQPVSGPGAQTSENFYIKQEPVDENDEAYFDEHVYQSEPTVIKDEPGLNDEQVPFEEAYPALAGVTSEEEEAEEVYEDGTKESDYIPGGRMEPIEVWDPETDQQPAATYSLPGLGLGLPLRPATTAVASVTQHSTMQQSTMQQSTRHDKPSDRQSTFTNQGTALDGESLFLEPVDYSKRSLGRGTRPPKTACFTYRFASHPYHHILSCGHTIVTDYIQKCASNCKKAGTGQWPDGIKFRCPHKRCIAAEDEKRRSATKSVFMPMIQSNVHRTCKLSHVEGADPDADRSKLAQEEEDVLAGMDTMGVSTGDFKPDQSHAAVSKSGSHQPGTIDNDIEECLPSGSEEEALIALNAGMKNRPQVEHLIGAKFSRELACLQVDGAEKLRQGAAPLMNQNLVKKLKRLPGAKTRNVTPLGGRSQPGSRNPALLPVPQEKDSDLVPHSFNKQGVRKKLATFDSIPEQDLERIIQAEDGVIIERDKVPSGLRALVGESDATEVDETADMDQEQDTVRTTEQAETFCVCGSIGDRFMRACDECGTIYHPGCVGKGSFAADTYQSEGGYIQHARDEKLYSKQGLAFICADCDGMARGRSSRRVEKGSALRTIQQTGRVEMRGRRQLLDEAKSFKSKRKHEEFLQDVEDLNVGEVIQVQPKKAKKISYRLKRPDETGRNFGPGTLASMRINTSEEIDKMYSIRAATDVDVTNRGNMVCDGCGGFMYGVFYRCLSCAPKINEEWNEMDPLDFCDRCVVVNGILHEEDGQVVHDHALEVLHVAELDENGRKRMPQEPDPATVDEEHEERYKRPSTAPSIPRAEMRRNAPQGAHQMGSLNDDTAMTGTEGMKPQKSSTPCKGSRMSSRLAGAKANQGRDGLDDSMEM